MLNQVQHDGKEKNSKIHSLVHHDGSIFIPHFQKIFRREIKNFQKNT